LEPFAGVYERLLGSPPLAKEINPFFSVGSTAISRAECIDRVRRDCGMGVCGFSWLGGALCPLSRVIAPSPALIAYLRASLDHNPLQKTPQA
jgi:hypothetical protein